MGFIDVLANEYAFASEDPVGRKNWEIIRDWNTFMDYDKEYYYHGRAKKDNGFIYTSDEMGKAPNEYVSFGRFNHMKQSHYYLQIVSRVLRLKLIFIIAEQRYKWQDFVLSVQLE